MQVLVSLLVSLIINKRYYQNVVGCNVFETLA
jgi:hypothetical protein